MLKPPGKLRGLHRHLIMPDDYIVEPKLFEGFNKRTLPLIPDSSQLELIPLGPFYEDDLSHFHYSEQVFDWYADEPNHKLDDRASDAVSVLNQYNRYVEAVRTSPSETQQQLSTIFIDLGSDITEIAQNANDKIRCKIEEMQLIGREILQSLKFDAAFLKSGRWAWLKHAEIVEKIKTTQQLDAPQIVDAVQSSIQKAWEESPSGLAVVELLEPFLQHLLTLDEGRTHALELCLRVKLGTCMDMFHFATELRFDLRLLEVLGAQRSFPGPALRIPPKQAVDLAALKRRVWDFVNEIRCQIPDTGQPLARQCSCRRYRSLELVHHLQIGAYSQIRAKVYLTLRALVPEELCDMIFDFALAAEAIPADPRVTVFALPSTDPDHYHRGCSYQHKFRDEYRCPKFRGLDERGWSAQQRAVMEAVKAEDAASSSLGSRP